MYLILLKDLHHWSLQVSLYLLYYLNAHLTDDRRAFLRCFNVLSSQYQLFLSAEPIAHQSQAKIVSNGLPTIIVDANAFPHLIAPIKDPMKF